ncbi:MAG: NF038132 family protein [Sphingomonadaceae bacterium]
MKNYSTAALAALATGLLFAVPAQADTCIGNCGSSLPGGIADGVVTPAPTGDGSYDWVSTFQGQQGAARIAGYSDGATNGSELISDPFFATAGQEVRFWFNYVTSDGAGFADYSFAQLLNAGSTNVAANLFTARTKPAGNVIAPGLELPDLEAVLNPGNVYITPGGPSWSALGGSSGSCYSSGCGYTGWVESVYTVQQAGSYQLRFGVANWSDTAYDSGLAFSGLLLDNSVIGDGSSADKPLLPGNIGPNGEFQFEFVATPNETVFIDPFITTGYDYAVQSGPNILSALFPDLTFDVDGYEIWTLDMTTFLGTALGGVLFDFTSLFGYEDGITGFALRGIDVANALDPTNVTAFVTGLNFADAGTVQMTQTPVTTFVPDANVVPEPATWAMMIAGFGLVGGALRRRRAVAA